MFSALDLRLGAGGTFFACAGPAIEFVTVRLSCSVLFLCFRPLVGARITAVSVDYFFFAGQHIGGDDNIMYVGSSHLYRMDQTALAVRTNVGLVAEMPCVSLFCRVSLRLPLLVPILGGGGRFNKG